MIERENLAQTITQNLAAHRRQHEIMREAVHERIERTLEAQQSGFKSRQQLLAALNPSLALERGFAIIRDDTGAMVKSGSAIRTGDIVHIEMKDARASADVTQIRRK